MIAIEEHWTSAGLTGALKAQPTGLRDDSLALNELGDHLRRLEDLGELRLAAMDEQGVDLQVLSLAPPGPGALAPADAVALSRELNDVAADAVARHLDRFRALATLPLADPAEAAAELERATRLGAVGVMLYGRTGDTPLDDPRYDEVLGLAASLGQPVFIHPQIPARAVREAAYGGFDDAVGLALSTFAWGWHLERRSPRCAWSPAGPSTATRTSRSCWATGASCCCSGRTAWAASRAWPRSTARSPRCSGRTCTSRRRACSRPPCCGTRSR